MRRRTRGDEQSRLRRQSGGTRTEWKDALVACFGEDWRRLAEHQALWVSCEAPFVAWTCARWGLKVLEKTAAAADRALGKPLAEACGGGMLLPPERWMDTATQVAIGRMEYETAARTQVAIGALPYDPHRLGGGRGVADGEMQLGKMEAESAREKFKKEKEVKKERRQVVAAGAAARELDAESAFYAERHTFTSCLYSANATGWLAGDLALPEAGTPTARAVGRAVEVVEALESTGV